ncbi:MAG: cytochrome C [Deltaproteobacteria bacterium]|nr:cytochrome C [Deltaproteobacteria bacterium]
MNGKRQRNKKYGIRIGMFMMLFLAIGFITPTYAQENRYIGSEACNDCHEEEYASFNKYAKKRHSYDYITRMRKGLTETEFETCLVCHTTGYGKPGGFVSVSQTPHLKNLGCECCHGPGSIHADSEDPDDIKGKLSLADCKFCHNAERVATFDFKPMIYGGAH